ncbi:MAG: 4'-phosphopantetheinyl transferase family protein [Gemmatimonadales bacterium]
MAEPRGPEHAGHAPRVAVTAWRAVELPALLDGNDAVVCCACVRDGRAAVEATVREILGAALGDPPGGGPRGAAPFFGTFDTLRPNVRPDVHHVPPATHVRPDVPSHVTTTTLAETDIAREPGGKPFLAARDARRRLNFNVSHSGDVLLVALSRTAEVGVDVERVRVVPEWRKIADRMFDARTRDQLHADIAAGDAEGDAFVRHWCRLEAAVKATGAGLFGARPENAPTRIVDLPSLPLPAGPARYHGAIAIRP